MKYLAFLFFLWCASCNGVSRDLILGPLAEDLEGDKTASLRFYFLPHDLNTFLSITPEMIEVMGKPINLDLTPLLKRGLQKALNETSLSGTSKYPDIRSAMLFIDQNGSVLHRIYLDGRNFMGTGRIGLIDEKSVMLNGALRSWIEEQRKIHGAPMQK